MIFYFILLTIIARAVNVQLVNGRIFEGILRDQITSDTTKKGQRGIIFDSNGNNCFSSENCPPWLPLLIKG